MEIMEAEMSRPVFDNQTEHCSESKHDLSLKRLPYLDNRFAEDLKC